jgi:hypothetical protein
MIIRATAIPDRSQVRDTIDLAAVATRLLGPAPGRRGERGRRLWWPCPFHEDRNPSFCVEPGKPWWRCYGCDAKGDAVSLARRLNPAMTFPEAVSFLTGNTAVGEKPTPRPHAGARPSTPTTCPECASMGMTGAEGLALVAEAEQKLWGPDGKEALAYLHGRGLSDKTIRAARLGWTPRIQARAKDGRPYPAGGIVIPWFDTGRRGLVDSGCDLALIKVRRPEGVRPKYAEVFRDRLRPPTVYPSPGVIQPGRPLVVVEGEFDALLLAQELELLAAVVTAGSASTRADVGIFLRALSASPWCIATDNDEAGDRAAEGWSESERARRVRPPGAFKDWTEAHQGEVNLRRWWCDVLNGEPRPPLFTWEELGSLRWGPAVGDPTPGIVID